MCCKQKVGILDATIKLKDHLPGDVGGLLSDIQIDKKTQAEAERRKRSAFFSCVIQPLNVRVQKLERQKYLNSEDWDNRRVDAAAHPECMRETRKGLHCFTCGRPIDDYRKSTTHHMRYPKPGEKMVMVRDTMSICGKCHHIILTHPEMQDPNLSKRGLRRMITAYLQTRPKKGFLGRMISGLA